MDGRAQLSPALRPYAETARAHGARLTTAELGPGRSSRRLDDLVRRLQRDLDRIMQAAFDSLPGSGEPACTAGCDHCCRSLPVAVSPLEVFAIVHRLRDTGAAAAVAAVRTTLPALVPSTPEAPLTPCPLLSESGLCTIYSSRPLACRGCVSADVAACVASGDHGLVPRSTVHQLGASAMMKGVCDALDALGLVSGLLEMRGALALALRDEDAERRWLRGEDVFAGLPRA